MSQIQSNIAGSTNAVTSPAALHVEVIADLVCPFCYLGKRRLDAALEAVQGPREISWYPWQLNPEMPAGGQSFDDYLGARFGSRDAVQPVLEGLQAEARDEGIEFRFDRIERVPNTLKAHQVMYLAELERSDASALAESLMAAFFTHGRDIGDEAVLLEIAARHGLAEEALRSVVADDKARQLILTREAQVRSGGIAGVPAFLLNRRLLVVGAQDKDNIVNAFDRAMFGEGTDELLSPAVH